MLLLAFIAFCSSFITYRLVTAKTEVQKEDFIGTYCIGGEEKTYLDDEYLVIDADVKSFVTYYAMDDYILEGECLNGQTNIINFKSQKSDNVGSLVYSYKKFYLVLNGKDAALIEKISDSPVYPAQ